MVWWILTLDDIDVQECVSSAFGDACGYSLDMARWLYARVDIAIDIRTFCSACFSGVLDVVKWLISLHPEIDLHFRNDFMFECACNGGNAETIRWFYYVVQHIVISNRSFTMLCGHDDLPLIKWLHYVGNIDLSIVGEAALGRARKHPEVIEWLAAGLRPSA